MDEYGWMDEQKYEWMKMEGWLDDYGRWMDDWISEGWIEGCMDEWSMDE